MGIEDTAAEVSGSVWSAFRTKKKKKKILLSCTVKYIVSQEFSVYGANYHPYT